MADVKKTRDLQIISTLITVCILCFAQTAFAGSIVSWGSGRNDEDLSLPPEGNDFVAIAAGERHNLALRVDGSIVAWGFGTENLGRWPFYGQAIAPDGNNFVSIDAGAYHSLALRSNGSIAAWGHSSATAPDANDFVAIAAGGMFIGFLSPTHEPLLSFESLALKSDGSIVTLGTWFGQATPPDGNDFVAIAAGGSHCLALKSDGSIIGWGSDWFGQATPPDGNDYLAMAAGESHSLAIRSDGSIVGWGNNEYGQATPPEGNDFVAIAAGGFHSLGLKSDGSIVGWGDNRSGQATPPEGNDFVAIAAGSMESLAIRETTGKYSGGTGEPNDPYQIATAEDLMLMGESTEDYDKHFILTADIDLDPNLPGRKVFNRAVIAPDTNDVKSGFQGTLFNGLINGDSHVISHLTIEGQSYLGLFGQLGYGTEVLNLGLEAIEIKGTGDFVGSFVGENRNGSIIMSYSTGKVKGNDDIGGLVGYNDGRITTSYSMSIINGSGSYLSGVGGLVGNNSGSIDTSFSTGTVTGYNVGGLVGYNSGIISISYNSGKVSGVGNGSSIGGLVGCNRHGEVSKCYNTGAVSGTGDHVNVGGLVGYHGRRGSISNCYSTGAVSLEASWLSYSASGGLVGYEYGESAYDRPHIILSFWDIETSGQEYSAGGIGKTTAEMQTAMTFLEAGWDFVDEIANGTEDIWWINEGKVYPRLWWE
ncbi:MAG: GLUG motif-containing protein [Planctomycetota bacterium]|jgi:hypothetical protein